MIMAFVLHVTVFATEQSDNTNGCCPPTIINELDDFEYFSNRYENIITITHVPVDESLVPNELLDLFTLSRSGHCGLNFHVQHRFYIGSRHCYQTQSPRLPSSVCVRRMYLNGIFCFGCDTLISSSQVNIDTGHSILPGFSCWMGCGMTSLEIEIDS